MNETEIERLVVRLVGDQADHLKMWDEADRTASKGANSIDSTTSKVGKSFVDMESLSSSAVKSLGMNMEALSAVAANKTGFMNMKGLSSDAVDNVGNSFMNMEALSNSATDAVALGMSRAGAEVEAAAKAMEVELAAAAEAMAEWERAAQRGDAITQSVETSSERYARQVAELDDLLKKGAITQETYNRATEDARKGQDRLSESASVAAGVLAANMVERTSARLKAMGREVIQAFSEQEDADVALTSSLEANGRAVRKTFNEYQVFSAELQQVTKYADESVIALLTQAETFNLTGEAAKKATKDAIALAALPGSRGSAESLVRLTAAMAQGDAERAMMFARMVPQLARIKDESKFLAEYQRLVAAGFKAEEAAAKTYSGAMAQASNATNDLGEDFGSVVANAMKPWIARFKEAIAVVKEFDPAVKEMMVVVAGAVVGIVGFMLAFNNIAITIQVLGPLMARIFVPASGAMGALTGAATITAGTFVAIAAAIALVAVAIYKLNPGIRELNAAMKEQEEINDTWITKIREGTRALIDRAKAMDLLEGQKFLGESLDDATTKTENLAKALARAKKEVDKLSGEDKRQEEIKLGRQWDAPSAEPNFLDKFFESGELKAARARLDEAEKLFDEAKASTESLAKTKIELEVVIEVGGMSAEQLKKLDVASKELTKSFQEQLETFGLTSRQAAIMKLALEGVEEAELAEARAIDETLTMYEEHHAATEKAAADNLQHTNSIKGVIESLEKQADTFGMTATQAALYSAKVAFGLGQITQAQLASVEAAAGRLDALTKGKEAMDKDTEMTNKANEVMKQFGNQAEKTKERRKELNDLLIAEKISLDVYNKAMQDLMKTEEAKETSKNADKNLHARDAAVIGSREAADRVQDYLQAMNPVADTLKDTPAFTAAESIEDVIRLTQAEAAAKSIKDALAAGVPLAGEAPVPSTPLIGEGSDTFAAIPGLPVATEVPQLPPTLADSEVPWQELGEWLTPTTKPMQGSEVADAQQAGAERARVAMTEAGRTFEESVARAKEAMDFARQNREVRVQGMKGFQPDVVDKTAEGLSAAESIEEAIRSTHADAATQSIEDALRLEVPSVGEVPVPPKPVFDDVLAESIENVIRVTHAEAAIQSIKDALETGTTVARETSVPLIDEGTETGRDGESPWDSSDVEEDETLPSPANNLNLSEVVAKLQQLVDIGHQQLERPMIEVEEAGL